jgi:hypothetical protein
VHARLRYAAVRPLCLAPFDCSVASVFDLGMLQHVMLVWVHVTVALPWYAAMSHIMAILRGMQALRQKEMGAMLTAMNRNHASIFT